MARRTGSVLRFSEIDKEDISQVGETTLHYSELTHAGCTIPPGFVVTSHAYFQFLKQNNLTNRIKSTLATVNFDRPESLLQASSIIRRYIRTGLIDAELTNDIFSEYKMLGSVLNHASVSLTASETSSHVLKPGEIEHAISYHDVLGESNVLVKIKELWASLFEAHAIFRRHRKEISHFTTGLAIIIQKNLAADASGMLYTTDPVSGNRTKAVIEARLGISEPEIKKLATPDHFLISKTDGLIIKKNISFQEEVFRRVGSKITQVKLTGQAGREQKISDDVVQALTALAKRLEQTRFFPQQAQWLIEKGKLYIVQTKNLEISSQKSKDSFQLSSFNAQLLATGTPASAGIATGHTKIIRSDKDIHTVMPHDIIVISHTSESIIPSIKKAAGIVTEQGGLTSHAAFLSRSLGIPAVIGVKDCIKTIKPGQVITINGLAGTISAGTLASSFATTKQEGHTSLATKLYLMLHDASSASKDALYQSDGGIFYAESLFTMLNFHPKKLLQEKRLSAISDQLAKGLKPAIQAFSPREVLYRLADFTSSEYRELLYGKQYEPIEVNPLLGYHGAFRYMHEPAFLEFQLSLLKVLRNKHALKNISLLIPYVRNVQELREIKRIAGGIGLHRTPTHKVYVQLQIPVNMYNLESFVSEGIDGIDIDTDCLTALLLGTDNKNEEVRQAYNSLDSGVLSFYETVVKKALAQNIKVTMSGSAVTKYPDLLERAVAWGVHGIVTKPEVSEVVRESIAHEERKILKR